MVSYPVAVVGKPALSHQEREDETDAARDQHGAGGIAADRGIDGIVILEIRPRPGRPFKLAIVIRLGPPAFGLSGSLAA